MRKLNASLPKSKYLMMESIKGHVRMTCFLSSKNHFLISDKQSGFTFNLPHSHPVSCLLPISCVHFLCCAIRESLRSIVASLQQSISSTLELSSMVQFVLGDGDGSLLDTSPHAQAAAPHPTGQSGLVGLILVSLAGPIIFLQTYNIS